MFLPGKRDRPSDGSASLMFRSEVGAFLQPAFISHGREASHDVPPENLFVGSYQYWREDRMPELLEIKVQMLAAL